MLTTRSPLPRRVLGAAAVPALLLAFAACGDDDDQSGAAFCDTAVEIDEQFASVDLAEPDALADITETMEDVDVPSDIADDWDTVISAYQAISEVDLEDAEAVTELQEDPQFENIDESADNIETYLEDECGIE